MIESTSWASRTPATTKPTVGYTRANTGWNIAGDEAADTLDEGAGEIVDTAVAAVHAALSTIGTDALRALLHSLLGLAEHVAPNRSAEIPIIPFTVFTPGIGLSINIKDNIGTIRKWADHPPHDRRGYLAMLRELADDEYAIVHLPNGVGKIPGQNPDDRPGDREAAIMPPVG